MSAFETFCFTLKPYCPKWLWKFFSKVWRMLHFTSKSEKKIGAVMGAIADPTGFGFLNLMFENANVPQKYRYMFGGFDEHNVLVDCGGNVGLITDIGLFLGMEIYTFEPSKAAFKLLKKKYDGNNRVHLYEKAVSDENTTLLFYSNVQELYDQGATIISEIEHQKTGQQYEVECVRLVDVLKNDILTKHKHIHLLKLDVEGAEFAIIEDIVKSGIYKDITYIVCETHERFFGKDSKKKIDHLHKLIKQYNIENIFLDWI